MKIKKDCKFVFMAIFLGIIAYISIFSIKNSVRAAGSMVKSILYGSVSIKTGIENIENSFNDNIAKKSNWIDLYGFVQRILKKNEVGNFDIIKDKAGILYMTTYYKHKGEETLLKYADNLFNIYQYAYERNIPFLYVITPARIINGKTVFDASLNSISGDDLDIDIFLSYINERNIPFLDIRQYISDMDIESIFYKTDHHWNLPASFRTMKLTIDKINLLYGMNIDIDNEIRNLDNYAKIAYPDSFLGSYGIRTGQYYTGKDDFEIYVPLFESLLEYSHYINDDLSIKADGNFYKSFIDEPIITNNSYNNKYNAFLHGGYCENRIKNYLADNSLKCLLISDSFSRSMTPYLSLCFMETRYLDPQSGRYTNSYFNYIDIYKPDLILVLFNGDAVWVNIPY